MKPNIIRIPSALSMSLYNKSRETRLAIIQNFIAQKNPKVNQVVQEINNLKSDWNKLTLASKLFLTEEEKEEEIVLLHQSEFSIYYNYTNKRISVITKDLKLVPGLNHTTVGNKLANSLKNLHEWPDARFFSMPGKAEIESHPEMTVTDYGIVMSHTLRPIIRLLAEHSKFENIHLMTTNNGCHNVVQMVKESLNTGFKSLDHISLVHYRNTNYRDQLTPDITELENILHDRYNTKITPIVSKIKPGYSLELKDEFMPILDNWEKIVNLVSDLPNVLHDSFREQTLASISAQTYFESIPLRNVLDYFQGEDCPIDDVFLSCTQYMRKALLDASEGNIERALFCKKIIKPIVESLAKDAIKPDTKPSTTSTLKEEFCKII